MAVRLNFVYSPRQPHRPRHLASKAHRVFFSSTLLRRRCRNLRQANGAATIPCSVSRRFTTCQLMLSLLSPEKAKGPGVPLLSPALAATVTPRQFINREWFSMSSPSVHRSLPPTRRCSSDDQDYTRYPLSHKPH